MENSYIVPEATLTEIADAIREKTGSTDNIVVEDFAKTIRNISCNTRLNTADVTFKAVDPAAPYGEATIHYTDETGITTVALWHGNELVLSVATDTIIFIEGWITMGQQACEGAISKLYDLNCAVVYHCSGTGIILYYT